jgi:hypothetical protein
MKEDRECSERTGDPLASFFAETKLRKVADFRPTDIFVVGYPKSGNTWMQYLIAGLAFGINVSLAPDSLIQELVPDVHYKQFYRRYLATTFFKTHDLPQPKYRKVIYVVRDGRDVIVSYFHHLKAIGTESDYSKLVTTGEGLFPCRWHEHVESWLANPYSAEMLMIRYEDLQRNTVEELQKICNFAGLEREQSTLGSVARETIFETMRAKERKDGWENAAWPKDKQFFRRGKIGSFQDEMPPQALEAFTKLSISTLKRLGYLQNGLG